MAKHNAMDFDMANNFSIEYSWSAQEPPDELGVYSEWSFVMRCLFAFLSHNRGVFCITIGTVEARFQLLPDLTTIFEELPHELKTLQRHEQTTALLEMFEQGTEVTLVLRRIAEEITVQFETSPGSGMQYRLLEGHEFFVPAHRFFGQWQTFLLAILDAISEFAPRIAGEDGHKNAQDESLIHYREQILSLSGVPQTG